MKFKNDEKKDLLEKIVETNKTDPYSNATVQYALRWANLMEDELAKGKKLEDIAEETSNTADTEGITGFMYNYSIKILVEVWFYGESLRQWHNSKYGVESDSGVVNSSIISIG